MDFSALFTDLFVPDISLAEKIIRPVIILIFLVFMLRLLGQRGLAQLNAFDLVVLLTLSNTVQNAIIGNDNSVLGGMVGTTALVLTNLLIVRFLYKHRSIDRRIEGEPVTLVQDGQVLRANLDHMLITEDELLAAVHRQGVPSVEECSEVILETSGTITVIPKRPTTIESETQTIEARLTRIEELLVGLAQPPRR